MIGAQSPAMVRTPPRSCQPRDLGDALGTLWRTASDNGGDVARALTINFIAVAHDHDEFALRQVAERLVHRSPARALLLSIDDALRQPEVEVAAVTRCNGKVRDVVLEEIFVRLPSSWFTHVPGLMRPLLISDLPTHLYWACDWSRDGRFEELHALADHSVVDSRRFSLPAVQLAELDSVRNDAHPITDLSWLRLRPWRRALAEAFGRVVWQPGTSTNGVIRHGRAGASTAILLAQWLQARLGARIVLEASGADDGSCPEAVTLTFAGCDIEASAIDRRVVVQVTTPAQCFLPFRLPLSGGTDGDLLAAAIDIA